MEKRKLYFYWMILALTMTACGQVAQTPVPQEKPHASSGPTTLSITAMPTNLPASESVSNPVSTDPPLMETSQPTNATPSHTCNQASLVEEITLPNKTTLTVNQGFAKVWRLKNTGSCTWTSDYQLVFVSGDPMSSPYKQPLTNSVIRPNEVGDVSITLVAPAVAGTYHGVWEIRDQKGVTFGPNNGGLNVEITTVLASQSTQTQNGTKLPDLYVSEFSIVPEKPVKGQPVHVTIGVYNQGDADAPKFSVSWYGLSSLASPTCTWDILNPTPPNNEHTLECDFVFQKSYPFNKTSLVVIDPGNHVPESDEGNNQGIISPFGVLDH